MAKKDESDGLLEGIAVVGLGILGGVILAAALSALSSNRIMCPACNKQIQRNSNPCPHCHIPLKWG